MSELHDKWEQTSGAAKKKLGEVFGDKKLEEKGREQEVTGKLGEFTDKASEKVTEAAKDVSAAAKAVKDKFTKKED